MAEIILTFNFDGTVKKQTKGFTGGDCIKKTKFIEEALGEAGERTMTKEFYDRPEENNTDKLRA